MSIVECLQYSLFSEVKVERFPIISKKQMVLLTLNLVMSIFFSLQVNKDANSSKR